jgi:Gene product 88
MKFVELLEGAEPKMPGAPSGIKIMTPQQFVAKSGDMPDEEIAEGPNDGSEDNFTIDDIKRLEKVRDLETLKAQAKKLIKGKPARRMKPEKISWFYNHIDTLRNPLAVIKMMYDLMLAGEGHKVIGSKNSLSSNSYRQRFGEEVAESEEHLERIRKLSGLDEATKLPAQSREFGGDEFQDYMNRIVGTPDLDKSGNVKVDKKGNEKYVSGKTKGDKYKMPYIHRSSVVTYLSPDGKTYDEDAVKKTLAIRPKSLLKQNEKMKHSNGEFEQFFNVGFAALVGIALDEQTNNLIVVNTCPGAGSCKVECFAMKGGKIQFKAAWQSDGRILTYLLNDPDGFFNQLSSEISAEASAAAKGDKKFPNGWQTTVRWHDAGDFFSPEYLDMALKMAAKHPDVKFYAYTKMAGAALAKKPDNFIINWSEGANTEQEKKIKAQDPKLDTTKNSRIVPEKLFYDLLAKDEKGNLKKTADGAWQPADEAALKEMKQRIATEYGISASSILSYTEYMAKRNSIPTGMKYNVIVAPGEGDVSANDPGVLSTLLLRH